MLSLATEGWGRTVYFLIVALLSGGMGASNLSRLMKKGEGVS